MTEMMHISSFKKEITDVLEENEDLRELLNNFIEINRSSPEVKWIALDDLAKVVEFTLRK